MTVQENAKKGADKSGYVIIGLLSLVYFIYMLVFCDLRSLWMDDLAQIQIAVQSTIPDMIRETISLDNNPPLFHLLSFFWIRMVPYGTGWLKLINIIFVSIGLYLCGLISFEIRGRSAGIICVLLGLLHRGVVSLAAYTFRPYGLYFCISALMLFLYIRSRNQLTKQNNLLFMVSMILAVYTHYFAVLLCICFFMIDIFLIWNKRLKLIDLFPYPAAALALLPWLAVIMRGSLQRLEHFWPQKPDMKALADMLYELLGYDKVLVLIVIAAGLIVFFYLIEVIIKKKQTVCLLFDLCLLCIPVCMILSVYFVSKYAGGFTSLFVTRYFVSVVPFIMVLCGTGFSMAYDTVINQMQSRVVRYLSTLLLLAVCAVFFYRSLNKTVVFETMFNEPFKEVSAYLMSQEDINKQNILVYNTCNELQEGWNYYLSEGGARDSLPVVWEALTKNDLEGIDKIYVAVLHLPFTEEAKMVLEDNGYQLTEAMESIPVQIYEKK
ncbi:MAG: hypothetical protein QM697_00430 [Lachnospiraceae bacterium]